MLVELWDYLVLGARWLFAAYGAMLLATVGVLIPYVVWIISIKPRLIPRKEIERLADEITAKHPDDPDHAAYRELEAAWWRSDSEQQITWKRVLKEIRRRDAAKAKGQPPA